MKKVTEIIWEKLPETYEDFVRDANGKMYEPEETAALFICALKLFMEDQELGAKCINLLTYNKDDEAVPYYSRLLQLLKNEPYIANSYFKDATSENEYLIGKNPTIVIKSDNAKGLKKNMKTVYIGCNGSGSYRPITLIRIDEEKADTNSKLLKPENDMWFVSDFVSILLDIKKI